MVDKLKNLIDADMLRYEVGFGTEPKNKETGEREALPFTAAITLLERKLAEMQEGTWATEPPTLYLTADEKLITKLNRRRKKEGKKPIEYKPNFREAIAVTKKYKGTRSGDKPVHFDNLTAYMLGAYKTKLAIGMEADDLISIDHNKQHKKYDTIICTRDKDLRITPGMHYGWSIGDLPAYGPFEVDTIGTLELSDQTPKKIKGTGLKFFYAQLITGDVVDNIPGLPRSGPVAAYDALNRCKTEKGLFKKVAEMYEKKFEKADTDWRVYFKEQAALLWMIQYLNDKGEPVHHVMFDER